MVGILRPMKTILVVDDERNIVDLAPAVPGEGGLRRRQPPPDGEQALALHARHEPDLVVLDLMLPRIDGFEVCRELRRRGDTPILMLTARDDDVDAIVGLELGADDYVTKPFNPRALVARVKAILRRTDGTRPGRPADGGRRRCGSIRAGARRPSASAGSTCGPASSTCSPPSPAIRAWC